jgi:hypothetical protein
LAFLWEYYGIPRSRVPHISISKPLPCNEYSPIAWRIKGMVHTLMFISLSLGLILLRLCALYLKDGWGWVVRIESMEIMLWNALVATPIMNLSDAIMTPKLSFYSPLDDFPVRTMVAEFIGNQGVPQHCQRKTERFI